MKKSKRALCAGLATFMLAGMSVATSNIEIINPTKANATYYLTPKLNLIEENGEDKDIIIVEAPSLPALTINAPLLPIITLNSSILNKSKLNVKAEETALSEEENTETEEVKAPAISEETQERISAKMLEQINNGATSISIINSAETLTETTTELTDCQENIVSLVDSYNSIEFPVDSPVITADSVSTTNTNFDIKSISLKDLTDMVANLTQNDCSNSVNLDSYRYDNVYLDINYGIPYIREVDYAREYYNAYNNN